MSVVFARTRHVYDSYWHFWKLVELSGYETCYLDEADLDDVSKCYVTTPLNGEITAWQRPRTAQTVWWCLEQYDPAGGGVPLSGRLDSVIGPNGPFDRIWGSDEFFCAKDHRIEFVRLGSDRALNPRGLAYENPTLRYDATPLAYLWGRRAELVEQLSRFGVRLGPMCYEEPARSEMLSTSRWILNLQQYPEPFIAPLRPAIAAAYGCALASEPLGVPYPHVVEEGDVRKLAALVREGGNLPRHLAQNLHQFLCVDNTFRSFVDARV